MFTFFKKYLLLFMLVTCIREVYSDSPSFNQTSEFSPVYFGDSLPFTISIELSKFSLPNGLQSFASAFYNDKYLFIAGRTNGLHGFNNDDDNFPPRKQNTTVYVVDFKNQTVSQKSLEDPTSALTQSQVDSLSTTASQYAQDGGFLYFVGGYGVDTATGLFGTKPILTSIDIAGLMHWVESPYKGETAREYVRQIEDPIFQVTGGRLVQVVPHGPFLLIFGQDFEGFYNSESSGIYTKQVRTFKLIDDGKRLNVFAKTFKPKDESYRRRDLNVVPIIRKKGKSYEFSMMALSGVFTEEGGIWTVPVSINSQGDSFMPNPLNPSTFKQSMNNYNSAVLGLFSKKNNEMYTVILGGLSYQTFENGVFELDEEVPFTNNVTTVRIDPQGRITQYVMPNEYPVVPSPFTPLGVPLYFGSGANFIPVSNISTFSNGVFSLDNLQKKKVLLGYVVGGIMSTVDNTISPSSETAASPYIFNVYIEQNL